MALTDNLAHYWTFDEASGDRVDEVGSVAMAPTSITRGVGPIEHSAEMPRDGFLRSATNVAAAQDTSFTWLVWVYRDTGQSQGSAGSWIVSRRDASVTSEYQIFYDPARAAIAFQIWNTPDPNTSVRLDMPTSSFPNDQWNQVFVWWDRAGGTINAQVNLGTVASTAVSVTNEQKTGGLNLGKAQFTAGSTVGLGGALADAGFWRRVLTSDERAELWNSGAGLAYPFVASGDLAATGTVTTTGTAALSATGSLAASGAMSWTPTADLTAAVDEDISATGSVSWTGTASLGATGTLAASGAVTWTGTASLTAVGALDATGAIAWAGTADLSGVGALTATGAVTWTPAADLSATGSLAATGTVTWTSAADLQSPTQNDIAATGSVSVTGSADLAAIGSLSAAATVTVTAAADLTATGTLAGTGAITWTGTATAQQGAAITATGAMSFTGTATLAEVSGLIARGDILISGTAALGATGSLSASAALSWSGTATLTDTTVEVARYPRFSLDRINRVKLDRNTQITLRR